MLYTTQDIIDICTAYKEGKEILYKKTYSHDPHEKFYPQMDTPRDFVNYEFVIAPVIPYIMVHKNKEYDWVEVESTDKDKISRLTQLHYALYQKVDTIK